jgi:o-succinylbenzoate synthase
VRIAELTATAFALPARERLRLASGTLRQRCGVLLEIVGADGARGLGEAALPEDTTPAVARTLADRATALAATWISCGLDLDGGATDVPAALRRGLEMAQLDLAAQRAGVRLAAHLGPVRREKILLNALIGRLPPEQTAAAAAAAVAAGYTCLKIKVDPRDDASAVAALRAARSAVGAEVAIRIDVNAGWSIEQAERMLAKVETLDIEYVEQPVATLDELRRLRSRVAIPLAADEGIDGPAAVRAAAGAVDVVVIKPTRMGLRRAVAAMQAAREVGLAVVLSSNLDSGVGITAALHLSALLAEPAPACGLATGALWRSDIVAPRPAAENGLLRVPAGPGLGIAIDRGALDEVTIAR